MPTIKQKRNAIEIKNPSTTSTKRENASYRIDKDTGRAAASVTGNKVNSGMIGDDRKNRRTSSKSASAKASAIDWSKYDALTAAKTIGDIKNRLQREFKKPTSRKTGNNQTR